MTVGASQDEKLPRRLAPIAARLLLSFAHYSDGNSFAAHGLGSHSIMRGSVGMVEWPHRFLLSGR